MRKSKIKISFVTIVTLLLFILAGCAAPKPKEVAIPKIEPVSFTISEVRINRKEFNPTKGEAVTISYRISKPAKAIIKIFDPDMCLVRDLIAESSEDLDINKIVWDGKDLEDRIVPDEAYFFTVEAMDNKGN